MAPRGITALKAARDLEICKTCVGVCTPVALRESFASSWVEERCFRGVNRLFTSLTSRGVMLLVGVREPQGVLRCQGGWLGKVQGKKRSEFRSCSVVPCRL